MTGDTLNPNDFSKIGIKRYFKFKEIPVNVYIKIGESKMVQIINKEEADIEEVINKYQEKGIKYFYLKEDEYKSFLKAVEQKLESILSNSEANSNDQVDAQVIAIESIHESIASIIPNPDAIKLINNVISSSLSVLKKNKDLSSIIEKILSGDSYPSQLATLTSYFSISTAKEMGINKEEQHINFGMASILQDSSLINESLAQITDLNSKEFKALSEVDQQLVMNHSISSKELLEQNGSYPPELLQFIAEHHERPEGKGFPAKLNHLKLSVGSCILILSHEYCHQALIHKNNPEKLNEAVTNIKENFAKGNFREPLKAFINVLERIDKKGA